jgi:RHS repeat-associated protein
MIAVTTLPARVLIIVLAMLTLFVGGNAHAAQQSSGTAVSKEVVVAQPNAAPPPPPPDDGEPLYNGAGLVTSLVPSTMETNGLYTVKVALRNYGTTTWTTAGRYALASRNPEMNTIWGLNRVPVGYLRPGDRIDFDFQVRAPSTPGTYSFSWGMVQEGVEWFGSVTNNTVTVVPPPYNNAAFAGQRVPDTMVVGNLYPVSVSMYNNGTKTWSAGTAHALGSQNPYDNGNWGMGRVALPYDVAPGQTATFNFQVRAPQNPGTTNFQWGMVQDGVEWFGGSSSNVPVNVILDPNRNRASVISMRVPPLIQGQPAVVSVTMQNNGTATWPANSNYMLGSKNPDENMTWGVQRVALSQNVAPGQQYTFRFPITVPASGSYSMQWQMMERWVQWFGDIAAQQVSVSGPGESITYIHTDALGSPVARTDGGGGLVSRTQYESYGLTVSGATPTMGFTGHMNDADTGLVYMQQRYYDPLTGRFMSNDPMASQTDNGGNFNRYAYGENSPYKYIDPDGRNVVIVINNNSKLIGTHVGVFVQGAKTSMLYDPGGSYRLNVKGSGDFLEGKDANLEKYIKFQLLDGKNVQAYLIQTTEEDDNAIMSKIVDYGGGTPGTCAIDSGNVLRGIGPFKDLKSAWTPSGMGNAVNSLPNGSIRRYIPGQGNVNDPTTPQKPKPEN